MFTGSQWKHYGACLALQKTTLSPSGNSRQDMFFYTKLCNHSGYTKLYFADDPKITDSYYGESTTMTRGVFMGGNLKI